MNADLVSFTSSPGVNGYSILGQKVKQQSESFRNDKTINCSSSQNSKIKSESSLSNITPPQKNNSTVQNDSSSNNYSKVSFSAPKCIEDIKSSSSKTMKQMLDNRQIDYICFDIAKDTKESYDFYKKYTAIKYFQLYRSECVKEASFKINQSLHEGLGKLIQRTEEVIEIKGLNLEFSLIIRLITYVRSCTQFKLTNVALQNNQDIEVEERRHFNIKKIICQGIDQHGMKILENFCSNNNLCLISK